ncbi:cilia- and flagella-associated protein 107 [Pseudoliparis swirei]|uniref:cilia- and flagella-associated protein 107 n=1 Tax=Pseudoliparis swirei TaxID=2059687 RepID=UPI0024BE6E47|nr:cilia- and flagella-associated protein 107 [Pseudoliparis swirei]
MNQTWARRASRTEQKYSNKVLIGNWAEERLQFTREPQTAGGTGRIDHRPHWDVRPDVSERRSALLRAEGLPSKLLFGHDDAPSSRRLVTLYEESYRREHADARPPNRCLLRFQFSHRAVNFLFCLDSSRNRRFWPALLPPTTTYGSAYQRHPASGYCQNRFARAPRALSSHLHAANHIHRDLDLRRRSLLQVPDRCWSPLPRTGLACDAVVPRACVPLLY